MTTKSASRHVRGTPGATPRERSLDLADRDQPVTVLRPSSGWAPIDWRGLWRHRELLFFLVWRDVKVRYKQTVLGGAWAVIQPLLTMLIFSLFFGRLARVPSDGLPYPIFSFTALVPWTFFANGLTQSANSLVTSQELVRKVYFPRLMIPCATVLSGIVDLLLGLAVLVAMMIFYGITPGLTVLWIVPLFALALLTSLGVGLWFSALNVQYRDVRYIVPFVVQIWLFATPIAYPSSLLEGGWRIIYSLNPMVGVVEGFRWALLSADTVPGPMIFVSAIVAAVLFLGGLVYFRSVERTFADVI